MNIEKLVENYLNSFEIDDNSINEKIETARIAVDKIIDVYGNVDLSQVRTTAVDKWTEYGWVPVLPSFNGGDILGSIIPPDTIQKADSLMLNRLSEPELKVLFDALHEYVKTNLHNETTLSQAISSFNSKLYSGCALLLFSLIDACFLTTQVIENGKRRVLANGAATKKIKRVDSILLSCANISLNIVSNLFESGQDFKPEIEDGLKRNFISHGMNLYNPNRTDCLKLFMLLHSIYLLFETGVFEWKQ